MDILDTRHTVGEDVGGLFIRASQDIPQEFLDECREDRDASMSRPAGNFHRVASLPAALVEQWKSQGFDVFRETPRAIVARLRRDQLDAFITTNRRV